MPEDEVEGNFKGSFLGSEGATIHMRVCAVCVYSVCVCAVVWNERVMAVALFWWLQTNELQIDAVVSSVCVCVLGALLYLPFSLVLCALWLPVCLLNCLRATQPLNYSTPQPPSQPALFSMKVLSASCPA